MSHPVYPSARLRVCLVLACAACLLVAAAGLAGRQVPVALLPAPLLLVLGGVALGVLWPGSGIFGRPLLAGPADRPLLALTFDDGPDPASTPKVLEVLSRHGATATFFVIGARAALHPELLQEMVRGGHQVENHSYHHAYTTPMMPVGQLAAELLRTQQVICAATGRLPTWFRPPVGLLSPRVAAAAARAGLLLCGYSCKARDGLAGTSVDEAVGRLLRGLRPGAILVLHDAAERGGRAPIAPQVLERLLPLIRERGLQPVTLARLLGEAAGEAP